MKRTRKTPDILIISFFPIEEFNNHIRFKFVINNIYLVFVIRMPVPNNIQGGEISLLMGIDY